jgi:chromosome segregation ATPase
MEHAAAQSELLKVKNSQIEALMKQASALTQEHEQQLRARDLDIMIAKDQLCKVFDSEAQKEHILQAAELELKQIREELRKALDTVERKNSRIGALSAATQALDSVLTKVRSELKELNISKCVYNIVNGYGRFLRFERSF